MTDERIEQCVTCKEQTVDIHYQTFSVCHPCFMKDPLGYSLVPSPRREVLAWQRA